MFTDKSTQAKEKKNRNEAKRKKYLGNVCINRNIQNVN